MIIKGGTEGKEFNQVLIVNDDEIFNEITEYTLNKSRVAASMRSMLDPAEALAYLGHCDPFPELILLDRNMPLMTGFDFLEKFIAAGHHAKRTMVVMFSTLIFDGEYERAMSFSCVGGYYTKPVRVVDFQEMREIFCRRFSVLQPAGADH